MRYELAAIARVLTGQVKRIEALLEDRGKSGKLRDNIRHLLDDVDARDSLAFVESQARKPMNESQ